MSVVRAGRLARALAAYGSISHTTLYSFVVLFLITYRLISARIRLYTPAVVAKNSIRQAELTGSPKRCRLSSGSPRVAARPSSPTNC